VLRSAINVNVEEKELGDIESRASELSESIVEDPKFKSPLKSNEAASKEDQLSESFQKMLATIRNAS
jgi:hypothetical protein